MLPCLQKLRAKAFKYVYDALVYDARLSGTVLELKINNCEGETVTAIAKRSSLCTVQIANHSNLCKHADMEWWPVKVWWPVSLIARIFVRYG